MFKSNVCICVFKSRVHGNNSCFSDFVFKIRLIAGSLQAAYSLNWGARDLGKGWRGDLGTFMISRPI